MIKTNKELANACENVAKNYKTLYVLGCFGWPMTESNKERCKKEYSYNRRSDRIIKVNAATADTFGFDCVNLIKALLWGWNGNKNASYGGSKYNSNNVPDITEGSMINACKEVSTDFSKIEIGEVVWMTGHIGVYIGNGLAVECTPKWKDCVQITAVHNIGKKSGYNGRFWTKHGKLPYITYEKETEQTEVIKWYRIRKSWEDAKSQVAAYKTLASAKSNCPIGYNVYDWNGKEVYNNTVYSLTDFIKDFQKICGAKVDGIAGPETLSKTITVSQFTNKKHPIVKPIQKRLYALGYTQVGEADGSAGPKFTAAVKAFQKANGCEADGEITAKNKTWKKLLGMK